MKQIVLILLTLWECRTWSNRFKSWGEIRDFLAKDWEVVLRRIPRECNLTTDHLARIGAVATTPTLCILDVPSFQLEALMFRDSLGSL